MMKDYNDKYQEYITFLQEKQKKVIREKHKEYSEVSLIDSQAKIDKSKMESYAKKAARSAAEFNANMMREKKDERRAYFDLQTYTVHFPKNKFATLPPKKTKIGAYPVAVLTGQYQDHYKRYSPEELKYFPVKTALHDPRKPVKYVRPMPESVRLAIIEKQIHGLEKCRICKQRSTKEERKNEKIVKCAQCGKIGHTSCLDLTEELVAVIKTYPWQCMECKACVKCMDPFDEDKMMFCDRCDRGYHTFCIGLEALPTGHWECGSCEGVPIILPKSKRDTSKNDDTTASEVATSEQVKSEAGNTSISQEMKTYPPVEPTLQEKKELLEEGEIPSAASATATGIGLPQTNAPGLSNSTGVLIPGPPLKIERRGRKRKYPLDPNKPKVSHKKQKPVGAEVSKQDRITGERQSRRLKLREEEEEEKKKKQEEKLELKKKKKKKKLRKLAAEAAAAAAAAAAVAYAESHPDEDCSGMLSPTLAQSTEKEQPVEKENLEGAKDNVDCVESTSENVDKDKNATPSSSSNIPEDTNTSEVLPAKSHDTTKVAQDVSDSKLQSVPESSRPKSDDVPEQSDANASSVLGKEVPNTDNSKPLTSSEQLVAASANGSADSGSGEKAVVVESATCDQTQEKTDSAGETKTAELQKESQDTTLSNEDISGTKPTTQSSDSPLDVPKEAKASSESKEPISTSQASEQTVSDDPASNPTQTLIKNEELPASSEETKDAEQTEVPQDKPNESTDTEPEVKKSPEASLQPPPEQPKETGVDLHSHSLNTQTAPGKSEESAPQPQPTENLNTSSPSATLKPEDPLTSTHTGPELPQQNVSSVASNPHLSSSSESSVLPSSESNPSTTVSDIEASSELAPIPSQASTEAPDPTPLSDIPLPMETSEVNQVEAVSTPSNEVSEKMETESDNKAS
ncbi:hypothetical protein EGW08_000640 [Elysia chlorotica]|uniref:PHD finger protein 10 n=1 Tax=Elysia chlorotica TaxID=188477 RepID=A0A433UCR7_ELYCH|nr:hypothetical protein EGW08_000640 [Elysia chlorotica]